MQPHLEPTDGEVSAAAAGDATAREALLRFIEPRLRLMVAGRLAASPQRLTEVDELAQVSLIAVSSSLDRLNDATWSGFKAFCSAIVAHKVIDSIRSGRRAAAPVSLEATVAALSTAAPLWACLEQSGTSPSQHLVRGELCEHLLVELGALKSEHREAITLAFFDQLPTAQVAQAMGISRPAASMLILRAVAALRARMERHR